MADARDAFERWYVGDLATQGAREIERDAHGNYILMQARLAWQAYHAGWLDQAAYTAVFCLADTAKSGADKQ